MRPEELPELFQAQLDHEGCAALFRDLGALDSSCEVSVKQAERTLIEAQASWDLAAAERALAAGEVRAVQVRYVHEGSVWIDTITRAGPDYRVVRMRAPRAC